MFFCKNIVQNASDIQNDLRLEINAKDNRFFVYLFCFKGVEVQRKIRETLEQ